MTEQVVETFVVVEGNPLPANLQPPQSELQGAFRRAQGQQLAIVIDMEAALPIARDMVRQARVAAFALNDAAFMKAQRTDDDNALNAAKTKGQQLADAPADPRLTAATTPDALLQAVADVIAEF
jgi:hypothetical protein